MIRHRHNLRKNFQVFDTNISKDSISVNNAFKVFIVITKKIFWNFERCIAKDERVNELLKKMMTEIVREVMNRILNVVISLRKMLINFKTYLRK